MKKLILAMLLTATSSGALAYDFNGDLNPKCAAQIMQQVPMIVQENAPKARSLDNLVPSLDSTFIRSTGLGDGTYYHWTVRVPFGTRGLTVMAMEIGVNIKNETRAACRFVIDPEVSVVNVGGGLGGGGGWGE